MIIVNKDSNLEFIHISSLVLNSLVHFIKPYRGPVHKYTWISVRFYEMGDMCKYYSYIGVLL